MRYLLPFDCTTIMTVYEQYKGAILTFATLLILTASLLLTGIPPEASDQSYIKTFHDTNITMMGSQSQPIHHVIVLGDAGVEINDQRRAKLCGGNLWIDHLAEALGADLATYAHGYHIRQRVVGRHQMYKRIERVKVPMDRQATGEEIAPLHIQVQQIIEQQQLGNSQEVLYILMAGSLVSATARDLDVLAEAANQLILDPTTLARRLLVIDTPIPANASSSSAFSVNDVAARLIHDSRVLTNTFDASGFLARMQTDHYKYGLKYPDHPCVFSPTRKCNRPDRFFWCQQGQVGNRAHFFLANDLIRRYFMESLGFRRLSSL